MNAALEFGDTSLFMAKVSTRIGNSCYDAPGHAQVKHKRMRETDVADEVARTHLIEHAVIGSEAPRRGAFGKTLTICNVPESMQKRAHGRLAMLKG